MISFSQLPTHLRLERRDFLLCTVAVPLGLIATDSYALYVQAIQHEREWLAEICRAPWSPKNIRGMPILSREEFEALPRDVLVEYYRWARERLAV